MRAVAIVTAATFALAGCSTATSSDPVLPTSVAPSSSPSANIVDSAIESTVARGTARISISIDSQEGEVTGSGSTALANGRGEINWDNQGSGESWIDLLNSDGTYTFVDNSWFVAGRNEHTHVRKYLPAFANWEPSFRRRKPPEGEYRPHY